MHKEKWDNTVGLIKDQFGVIDEKKDKEEMGEDINGKTVFEKMETIEFDGPLGRMKLELITRPIVLEKKTNFSRRIGSDVGIKYIYSDTEESSKFHAYKLEDDNWVEIDGGMFD